jgi:hypothetical protein
MSMSRVDNIRQTFLAKKFLNGLEQLLEASEAALFEHLASAERLWKRKGGCFTDFLGFYGR